MKINRTLFILFAVAGCIPPIIFRVINWYYGKPFSGWANFSLRLLISVITTVTISMSVVNVIFWLERKYPWHQNVLRRLGIEMILTSAVSCGVLILLSMLSQLILPVDNLRDSLFNWLVVAMIMNAVLVTITEGIFFFQRWRKSDLERERFKKANAIAQFENLKNQVNPHFLFNSLNTLSSMIDYDQEQSKEFIDDLSDVYRYVLQHQDDELITLNEELDFISSYCSLLRKRHGDRIAFHFNIGSESMEKSIPPMALQLLLENAVKHNVASKKRPLTIEIFDQNQWLIVRNNLQRKNQVPSSGLGLKNIQERYKYLTHQNVVIDETESRFQVKIPLIVTTEKVRT